MNIDFSHSDIVAISPLLITLIGALILLLIESFITDAAKLLAFPLSIITLLAALFAASSPHNNQNPLLTNWLRFDSLAHILNISFLSIGLLTVLLSYSFFKTFQASQGEYYFLLLSSLFGLLLIGSAADFLTLFLGLETLSIALYILCGYMKRWELSREASLKYFLMGAIAAAFLLYGIALIYGATGTTQFKALMPAYQSIQTSSAKTLFLSGIALITLGLAFKAAIVPFHVWAPDVYDGAPTPVTAFMAVGTKVGAFAAFALVFLIALPNFDPIWNQAIALLAYPTLIYANLVAIKQTYLRRFFAYSGISHAGYLLIPLAAGTADSLSAMSFYLAIYALATLGCFSVLSFLDKRPEGIALNDLYGLFRNSPLLAGVLTLCLLTLAGIPPTAGFFAKFYLFKVAFEAGYYTLLVVGLLASIFSAYYYLRIISIMFTESSSKEELPSPLFWPAAIVGGVTTLCLIILSCYPEPLLNIISKPG